MKGPKSCAESFGLYCSTNPLGSCRKLNPKTLFLHGFGFWFRDPSSVNSRFKHKLRDS